MQLSIAIGAQSSIWIHLLGAQRVFLNHSLYHQTLVLRTLEPMDEWKCLTHLNDQTLVALITSTGKYDYYKELHNNTLMNC